MSFQIYKKLAWLNELPAGEAESAFLDCCGSGSWARRMAKARPFPLLENLFGTAQSTWFSLSPVDWLEAFAAHPKIGSSESVTMERTQSAEWSTGEQSGMDSSDEIVHAELGEANRLYRDKFGFIFIVCATGKTAVEMLAICRARLGNSATTEFLIAAEEQKKITEIRLTKLLEQ